MHIIKTPQGEIEITTFQDGRWWGATAGKERIYGWLSEERALDAMKRLLQFMEEIKELRNGS